MLKRWWEDQKAKWKANQERQVLLRQQAQERAEEERRQREEALRRQEEERRREEQALRALQGKVLSILEEGKVPDLHFDIGIPFRLLRNERLVFVVNGARYGEMRIKREIQGRSAGTSVRVMKGVYIRTAASRGTPVEREELTDRGTGLLAISNKHLFFNGERSFRIPLAKVVSAQMAGPGTVEVVRDRASALPEYFAVGKHADFLVELLHVIPSVDFGRGALEIYPRDELYGMPLGLLGADDMLEDDAE